MTVDFDSTRARASHALARVRRNRFAILLTALALLLLCAPLVRLLGPGVIPGLARVAMTVVFAIMLLAAVFAIGQSRATALVAFWLATPAILLQGLKLLVEGDGVIIVGQVFEIAFLGFTIAVSLRFLFTAGRVTHNTIWAAVCVYLLLGVLWASALAEDAGDGMMRLGGAESIYPLYYSLVTMTTLGYGDVVPASPVAQMLAVTEAITGQLYLAVLVARLVGLHIAQSIRNGKSSD